MLLALAVIIVCIGINAVLSCAEMAFVSIDKNILHNKVAAGDTRAADVERMREAPERILSVVQIGITFVGAVSGAVGGSLAKGKIGPWMVQIFNMSERLAESLSISVVVVPITFLSIVIGELVPKSLAIKYPFKISTILSPTLRVADRYLGFIVNPLEKMTGLIVSFVLPQRQKEEMEPLATAKVSLNGLKTEHKGYVLNLMELDARAAKDAMVKWESVEFLMAEATSEEIYNDALIKGHTRFPVIESGKVRGFLHVKDYLQLKQLGEEKKWIDFVRPITFVDSEDKLLDALRLMKLNKAQILVVGTKENPKGILTLQDVIEEVIGDVVEVDKNHRIVKLIRHRLINNKD